MSERINVGVAAYAAGAAIQAGVNAAVASIRYDRARASQRASLATIHDAFLERARVQVAQRNIRILLDL
ncbi:hypothetical protein [Lichenibacterium ramalinae]|uniref:Uncharacterized protein n=1 Tax=Lichenibacterium ramalinae TaxID=2316527 RepID=A0A4Q2RCK7_9HYPH|nr:hypothetical protein [Lichenibacterium ramalinae]RYB03563.1 hypothetical protein D3272_15525 [Lichenibacterium ramalinae]